MAKRSIIIEDFERFLQEISTCFIDGNFEEWRAHIVLPFSMITSEETIELKTVAALEENFKNYLLARDIMQLTQVHRESLGFVQCTDGTWLGTYKTYLLSGDELATASYTSTALLLLSEGSLKMSAILNARGTHEWVTKAPEEPFTSQ